MVLKKVYTQNTKCCHRARHLCGFGIFVPSFKGMTFKVMVDTPKKIFVPNSNNKTIREEEEVQEETI